MKNITPKIDNAGLTIIPQSPLPVAASRQSAGDIAPAWHAEAITLLKENFGKIHSAFTDATKRAVWMGMFLSHIKARGKEDKSIGHGEFGPWLEKNVPTIPVRTAQTYMGIADGVCKTGHFEIRQFSVFASSGELPPVIEALVDGKTQTQLLLEFKDTSPKKDKAPARKLTPSQALAEEIKNIEACFAAACGALEMLIALDPQKFIHPHPADRAALAAVCRKYLELEKQFKGEITKTR